MFDDNLTRLTNGGEIISRIPLLQGSNIVFELLNGGFWDGKELSDLGLTIAINQNFL